MKKLISSLIILAMAVCALIGLSACGDAGDSRLDSIKIAGGSPTGGYYLQSSAVATLLEDTASVDFAKIEATIGAYENLLLLSEGIDDAALADSYAYHCAINGLPPFEETLDGFSLMLSAAPMTLHLVVRESSDIYSLGDLAGHSLATGTAGSASEAEIKAMLESLGLEYADMTRVDLVGVSAGLTELQNGLVDAAVCLVADPNATIVETALGIDLRLVGPSREELETLLRCNDWLGEALIPEGLYKNVDSAVASVSVPCAFLVRDGISEDSVYQMAKTIYEHREQLTAANSAFKLWTMLPEEYCIFRVHGGAARFFDELAGK